jgi:hypothetical protein
VGAVSLCISQYTASNCSPVGSLRIWSRSAGRYPSIGVRNLFCSVSNLLLSYQMQTAGQALAHLTNTIFIVRSFCVNIFIYKKILYVALWCLEWLRSPIPQTLKARGNVVGWGTMLQAGMSQVRIPMRLSDYFQLT